MWMLERAALAAIQRAEASGWTPPADTVRELEASIGDVLSIAGDNAQINVVGVLTATRSWMAYYFGGGNTTYPDIMGALAAADADPTVKEITMYVDSPGGHIHGLFETIDAIKATTKPVHVRATRACSAAYALIAPADSITANSRASFFGSFGVVVDTSVYPEDVSVTSTEAPDKRPDLSTDEGCATLRKELDAVHDLMAEATAGGRGTTVEDVNKNYGRGATLLADDALSRGMIDSIGARSTATPGTDTTATGAGIITEQNDMTEEELKAQHPVLYAAVRKAGATEAVAAERDRVNAFLTAGDLSGDMGTAVTAIKEGSAMTMTLTTQFMMASANKGAQTSRQEDAQDAAPVDGVPPTEEAAEKAASDKLASGLFEMMGIEGDE